MQFSLPKHALLSAAQAVRVPEQDSTGVRAVAGGWVTIAGLGPRSAAKLTVTRATVHRAGAFTVGPGDLVRIVERLPTGEVGFRLSGTTLAVTTNADPNRRHLVQIQGDAWDYPEVEDPVPVSVTSAALVTALDLVLFAARGQHPFVKLSWDGAGLVLAASDAVQMAVARCRAVAGDQRPWGGDVPVAAARIWSDACKNTARAELALGTGAAALAAGAFGCHTRLAPAAESWPAGLIESALQRPDRTLDVFAEELAARVRAVLPASGHPELCVTLRARPGLLALSAEDDSTARVEWPGAHWTGPPVTWTVSARRLLRWLTAVGGYNVRLGANPGGTELLGRADNHSWWRCAVEESV